ncbi:type II toxin-antitoxin system VapC family toxin [Elstera cyanobacteriorum]|uniref:type II toxin-antitoxin system VapC family toxin n=1 Tax=Elstera cyanobacteriorum TaxID=2022747 RepID=UPI0023558369|nr:type II toxin-antitoxin system VapC family toxin [Elstera cyanobacteriorum]MCK6441161.1 type II toxin-antitoxin system VapC family toxin [Elstera cyanobacteriorum]
MILLDTNILSEVMCDEPDPRVLAWLDAQAPDHVFTSTITEAEIRFGIALLAEGRRKALLCVAADRLFVETLSGRILPFGRDAALHYAALASERRRSGNPISTADCQIASIARAASLSLATRNIRDFDPCGVPVINPWETV